MIIDKRLFSRVRWWLSRLGDDLGRIPRLVSATAIFVSVAAYGWCPIRLNLLPVGSGGATCVIWQRGHSILSMLSVIAMGLWILCALYTFKSLRTTLPSHGGRSGGSGRSTTGALSWALCSIFASVWYTWRPFVVDAAVEAGGLQLTARPGFSASGLLACCFVLPMLFEAAHLVSLPLPWARRILRGITVMALVATLIVICHAMFIDMPSTCPNAACVSGLGVNDGGVLEAVPCNLCIVRARTSEFNTGEQNDFDTIAAAFARANALLGGKTCVEALTPRTQRWSDTCGRQAQLSAGYRTKVLIGFRSVMTNPSFASLRPIPTEFSVVNAELDSKTGSIVQAAQKFETGAIASVLRSHRVWELDANNLVALREQLVHPLLVSAALGGAVEHSAPVGGDSVDTTEALARQLRCELYAHAAKAAGAQPRHLATTGVSPAQTTAFRTLFMRDPKFRPPLSFRVVALMAGFNDGDVVTSSVWHLLTQGCAVHFIDNWSTDGTRSIIRSLQHRVATASPPLPGGANLTYELFPATRDTGTYDWAKILRRKAQIATDLAGIGAADWFIHVDPDEIRESPWGAEVSLRQGLYAAQVLGYNLANFKRVLVFHPVHDAPVFPQDGSGDLLKSFEYWDKAFNYNDAVQIKAWRGYRYGSVDTGEVDLSVSGGHRAEFVSQLIVPRICPWGFVLRHYPVRSQAHGQRKVFHERKARWNREEVAKRHWHVQYDGRREDMTFLRDAATLRYAPHGQLPRDVYEQEIPCLEPVTDRAPTQLRLTPTEATAATCHRVTMLPQWWWWISLLPSIALCLFCCCCGGSRML